jgi:hypothetical protein
MRSRSGRQDPGAIGTMIAPSELDDESYIDFVDGLRAFALTTANEAAKCQAPRSPRRSARSASTP